jgi:hypothetical protein
MKLNKELKILLLQVLKHGEITKDDADALIDCMKAGDLIKNVTITFKKYEHE